MPPTVLKSCIDCGWNIIHPGVIPIGALLPCAPNRPRLGIKCWASKEETEEILEQEKIEGKSW